MRDGSVPKKLFKYAKYKPSFFNDLLLRITPLHGFNDPFEGVLSKDSYRHLLEKGSFKTEEKRQEALNQLDCSWGKNGAFSRINHWGAICFAGKCDCLVMWAHYADEHKGILIEFDTTGSGTITHPFFEGEMDTNQNPPQLLKIKVNPIDYPLSSKRPSAKPSTMEEMYMSILYFAFSKSSDWSYEEEHRMILDFKLADEVITPPVKKCEVKGCGILIRIPKKTMYFKKIPEEIISKIYIGCRAENKDEIIDNFVNAKKENSKLEHVRLYESILDDNDFKVKYSEISLESRGQPA